MHIFHALHASWHRRLSHINEKGLNCLAKKDMLSGLKNADLEKCSHCTVGKQTRVSFKKHHSSRKSELLKLIHLDVCGPLKVKSFSGALYFVTFINDCSRYTWTLFLTHKSDAFHAFKKLAKVIQNKKNLKIASIRSDHGGEFENKDFESFCDEHDIEHNFSAPRTP